ncbi:MAG: class I tRNA ligase family protein, partial [Bacteroidetes bacterium]|nr:class I tRNA ligase family protein [Bacteroidota bacterium]
AVNSAFINGLGYTAAFDKVVAWLEEKGRGRRKINYKLRDWLFSRQRYWGEPFPIIHVQYPDGHEEIKLLPEEALPVTLPEMESYKPSGTGESPLATIDTWVNTTDPETGFPARRETNTMPQWAGSCWYYLRFMDPDNKEMFVDKRKEQYWGPIDLYVGGTEHAVLHLLYARFWHKVLFDLGHVSTKEPFMRLVNQGMILGEDGRKMSKSFGNVINPDDVIRDYGADTLRLFEMFMGPLEQVKPWNTKGVEGVHRFLNRVWRLFIKEDAEATEAVLEPSIQDVPPDEESLRLLHKTIRKVGDDIEGLRFNTAISQMMIFVNEMNKRDQRPQSVMETFILLLAPFAPHLAEELWWLMGHKNTLAYETWPSYDPVYTIEDEVEVILQVNGKLRDKVRVAKGTPAAELEAAAMESEKVRQHVDGKTIVKVIAVPDKLVNIVVR